jgi:hypothetical protein
MFCPHMLTQCWYHCQVSGVVSFTFSFLIHWCILIIGWILVLYALCAFPGDSGVSMSMKPISCGLQNFQVAQCLVVDIHCFWFQNRRYYSGGNQLTNTVKSSHREINVAQYLFKLTWTLLEWFWKSHPTISCTRCVMLCEFPILCLVVLTILKLLPTHLSSICLLSFRFQSSNIPTQWQPRQGCWLFPASSWCWWYAALYHWWLFVSFKCLYCWHTMCFNFRGDRFLFYGCQYLTSLQEVKKPMAG